MHSIVAIMQRMDWDDIRFFLAVARKNSIRGGSATLGVNHSTVSRRINSFEQKLDVRLFDRLPTGYILTPAGEDMLSSAERIEEEVNALDRKVLGRDAELNGQIRVTMPAPIVNLITPDLVAFTKIYPGIELELLVSYEEFNLSKREADVAIRITNNPPDHLVGRKILKYTKSVYASKSYLKEYLTTRNSELLNWIGWDSAIDDQWIKKSDFPNIKIQHLLPDAMAQLAAIKAGLGITILPCFMCEVEADLQRVPPAEIIPAWDIWLLTHKDLRDTTRIKTFMSFMTDA
ncbi:MAG: LysR family transcriptional regulator, partial [Thiohalomonadales bacterium]